MLLKKNYEREHLEKIAQMFPKVGKAQLQATVFAFGNVGQFGFVERAALRINRLLYTNVLIHIVM